MKKILLLSLVALLMFSCQKKEGDPVALEQEVVFNAAQINPSGLLKSTEDWECKDLSPDYAKIQIGDDFYYPDLFRVTGRLYTQAIKLEVPPSGSKTFTVNQFLIMHDGGIKGYYGDDTEIVMATPSSTGLYKEYVSQPVDFNFTLNAYSKMEIPIDVLCFQDLVYENFGFEWFQVTEIVIREQCFFGDICLDGQPYSPGDYLGSLYDQEQLPPGCLMDMPAIMQIVVKKDGVEVENSPFTNATVAANYGVGAPLCVQYPDELGVTEEFTFELWILVKNTAGGFSYQLYETWTEYDEGQIPSGTDGVVDFVVGNCNMDPADYNYAWLPAPDPVK